LHAGGLTLPRYLAYRGMGEECDLRQLMLGAEADEEDSPDREEPPPPPPPPPAMPLPRVKRTSPPKSTNNVWNKTLRLNKYAH